MGKLECCSWFTWNLIIISSQWNSINYESRLCPVFRLALENNLQNNRQNNFMWLWRCYCGHSVYHRPASHLSHLPKPRACSDVWLTLATLVQFGAIQVRKVDREDVGLPGCTFLFLWGCSEAAGTDRSSVNAVTKSLASLSAPAFLIRWMLSLMSSQRSSMLWSRGWQKHDSYQFSVDYHSD